MRFLSNLQPFTNSGFLCTCYWTKDVRLFFVFNEGSSTSKEQLAAERHRQFCDHFHDQNYNNPNVVCNCPNFLLDLRHDLIGKYLVNEADEKVLSHDFNYVLWMARLNSSNDSFNCMRKCFSQQKQHRFVFFVAFSSCLSTFSHLSFVHLNDNGNDKIIWVNWILLLIKTNQWNLKTKYIQFLRLRIVKSTAVTAKAIKSQFIGKNCDATCWKCYQDDPVI